MDNKIFDVNGRTKVQLILALKCLLQDEYGNETKVTGYYFSKQKGLVLTWLAGESYKKAIPFTNRMGIPEEIKSEELIEILWDWLSTESANSVDLVTWEDDADHDGSNEPGWRLYVEDWGHIHDSSSLDHYSIAAFKKVFCWYGK